MTQPTIASIPGILTRASLKTVARLLLVLVWATLLLTVTLGMLSLFLGTYQSSRTDKREAITDVIGSLTRAYKTFARVNHS